MGPERTQLLEKGTIPSKSNWPSHGQPLPGTRVRPGEVKPGEAELSLRRYVRTQLHRRVNLRESKTRAGRATGGTPGTGLGLAPPEVGASVGKDNLFCLSIFINSQHILAKDYIVCSQLWDLKERFLQDLCRERRGNEASAKWADSQTDPHQAQLQER